ncbi:MAG TPA: VWA domain-containing protein [Myxococcota bacterium]
MQRTAVIFGLAASSLVGALLLVPRTTTQPAVAMPTPPPSSASITQLIYGDGVLEVRATLDRSHLATASSEPVWVDVAVRASGVQQRAPLAAALVIDRSGSMAGDKIDAARLAAERFINGLADGDMLALVSYGSDVSVDLPFVVVDGATRRQALGIVRNIEEGGGTNIDGGLRAAEAQLKAANVAGHVARVILVSDGRPTEGDRRSETLAGHARDLRGAGFTTSTIGLGLDYNEDLMEQLAVVGGGRYHYLKTGAQMAKILDDELQHGRNVVASNVHLHLDTALAPGLRAVEATGYEPQGRGSRLVVDIGDLAAGEERHVLVKVAVDAVPGEGGVGFAAPELTYKRAGDRADHLVADRADAFRMLPTTDLAVLNGGRNDDVRARVLQVEASVALTQSMQAYASGDAEKAKKDIDRARTELKATAARTGNQLLLREAQNLDAVYDNVASGPASSAAGLDMVKAQKARAFDLRR